VQTCALPILTFCLAYAVLGAEAAAEVPHDIQHHVIHVGCVARDRIVAAPARHEAVVVEVPIAQVPETDDARTGDGALQGRSGRRDEFRQSAYRYRDIVPVEKPLVAGGLRYGFAQLPQRL